MDGTDARFQLVAIDVSHSSLRADVGILILFFVCLWLVRRSFYSAIVCTMPMIASLAAVFLTLMRVAQAMSIDAGGRAAAAAGCAEAQVPLLVGSAATLLLSGALVVRPVRGSLESAAQFRVAALICPSMALLGVGELEAARWLVAPGRVFSRSPITPLRTVAWLLATLGLLASVAVMAHRPPAFARRGASRRSALLVFVTAAVLLTIARSSLQSFQRIAILPLSKVARRGDGLPVGYLGNSRSLLSAC